jgi:hypothetical protein
MLASGVEFETDIDTDIDTDTGVGFDGETVSDWREEG